MTHRILKAIAVPAVILSLASCDNGHGRPIDELSGLSTADSMIYFYGQMKAYDYGDYVNEDSTLDSYEARMAYLKGIKAGFNSIKDNDKAYNLGVRDGMVLALKAIEFNDEYHERIDRDVLLQSLRYGLVDNSTIHPLYVQQNFYDALHKINTRRMDTDLKTVSDKLEYEASIRNMKKISDLLYKRIVVDGTGSAIRDGDILNVSVSYARHSGEDIGMPHPTVVTVGSDMSEASAMAYRSMTAGESASFATSAFKAFGNRCDLIDLHPDDVVLIRVTVNSIETHADDLNNDTGSAD